MLATSLLSPKSGMVLCETESRQWRARGKEGNARKSHPTLPACTSPAFLSAPLSTLMLVTPSACIQLRRLFQASVFLLTSFHLPGPSPLSSIAWPTASLLQDSNRGYFLEKTLMELLCQKLAGSPLICWWPGTVPSLWESQRSGRARLELH